METLDPSRVQAALTTQVFGRNLVILPRTGSTNTVAKKLAAQGAPEGTVVVADEQTAGRGRMGRRWSAPPGTCLLCSILFRPDLPLTRAQQLTMVCSMAMADAVVRVAGLHVDLKWPNDLIVQSPNWKKLAGLLTETEVMGEQLKFTVVGIGVNVNVKVETLPSLALDATSILAETEREVDRVTLLVTLLAEIEARYARLQAGENPHAEWSARLATLGQVVDATTSTGVHTGIAESVDRDGALLLRTPDGGLHLLLAGDVTLTHR
jgi:BirA family biotin operon repressor/biotin-[acetyl-CoA-carboxylase] ligase